jgi:hypothetical protein
MDQLFNSRSELLALELLGHDEVDVAAVERSRRVDRMRFIGWMANGFST